MTAKEIRAVYGFHSASGVRVALGLGPLQVSALAVFIALQPNSGQTLLGLTSGVVTTFPVALPRIGLAIWAWVAATMAVRRLRLAASGWLLHLPVSTAAHRLGMVLGTTAALSHVGVVWLVLWLTALSSGEPASVISLLALPAVLVGAACASLPAVSRLSRFGGLVATLLGASASPIGLACGALLVAAILARPTRGRATRGMQTSDAGGRGVSSRFLSFSFSWRAIGVRRALVGYLLATPVLAAVGLFLHNNELTRDESDLALRLGVGIALACVLLFCAAVLAARLPPWSWARSLPWSARYRVASDAVLLMILGTPVVLPLVLLHPLSAFSVIVLLTSLSLRLSGHVRGSPDGLTRLGAWTYSETFLVALTVGLQPWIAIALAAVAPWVLEASARHEHGRRVSVFVGRRYTAAEDLGR